MATIRHINEEEYAAIETITKEAKENNHEA